MKSIRTYRKLRGARREQLGYVIDSVEALALRRVLTPTRMPAAFVGLDRNRRYWRSLPFPAARDQVSFKGSEIVYVYFPGEGLQLHPLTTFKKANAMHGQCERQEPECDPEGLRRLLDEMDRLAVQRSKRFIAWEYGFHFGGGAPPWISGMADATAIQAYGRASALLDEPRYLDVARRALGAFETLPPLGVRTVGFAGGIHYLQYSFAPRLYIFNAFLQSLIGLHDFARMTGDERARELFEEAEPEAREEIPLSDVGDWSRYSYLGAESTADYHELLREFLASMCTRRLGEEYCEYADRYRGYQVDPPELTYTGPELTTAKQLTALRFQLSKLSAVEAKVYRGDKLVFSKIATFRRGVGAFAWRPKAPGMFTVRLGAKELRTGMGKKDRASTEIEVDPQRAVGSEARMAPRTILYTGKGGVGKTSVAAATARRCAAAGLRTVVLSTDPAHSLSDSLEAELGAQPSPVGPNLFGQEVQAQEEMERHWESVQGWLGSMLEERGVDRIAAEELTVPPGMDELFSLLWIKRHHEEGEFDCVIVDCAPTGETLRLLSFPDVVTWWLERILPSQRRLAPFARTLFDLPLPGDGVFDDVERLARNLVAMNGILRDRSRTSVRLVMNADRMVVKEAMRTFTYLNLYGYLTDAVVVNRLLPAEGYFAAWSEVQAEQLELVRSAFEPVPVLTAPYMEREVIGPEMLDRLAGEVFGADDPAAVLHTELSQQLVTDNGRATLRVSVPFAEKGDLSLKKIGTEVIVRVGAQKRTIMLPPALAAYAASGARFEDGTLEIQFEKNEPGVAH